MTDQPRKLTITEQIDTDEGLKSKRKLLIVTSLVLMALSFSGAKVEEANTFVLKLSFESQKGIPVLLILSVVFLLVRYYNYACKYHKELYDRWTKRLLKNSFFLHRLYEDPHHYELSGFLVDQAPFDIIQYEDDEHYSWLASYTCEPFFKRQITYTFYDENGPHYRKLAIGRKNYFKVLRLEAVCQLKSFFIHRENLDITSPYILGVLAILSFIYRTELQSALCMLTV